MNDDWSVICEKIDFGIQGYICYVSLGLSQVSSEREFVAESCVFVHSGIVFSTMITSAIMVVH